VLCYICGIVELASVPTGASSAHGQAVHMFARFIHNFPGRTLIGGRGEGVRDCRERHDGNSDRTGSDRTGHQMSDKGLPHMEFTCLTNQCDVALGTERLISAFPVSPGWGQRPSAK
jgi:hypothetical protein